MKSAVIVCLALLLVGVVPAHGQLYVRVQWSSTTATNIGAQASAEYRNYSFGIDYYWYIYLDCVLSGPRSDTSWRSAYGTVSVGCGIYESMPGWRLPSGCYRATGSGKATKGSETSSQSASTSQFCLSDPTPPPTEPVDICEGQSGDWQCSPIVINLADGPWKLSGAEDPVFFDIDADGLPNRITWTGRDEPLAFLALDRNSNGIVDDGGELFGTATRLRTGARAPSGFEALKELDGNGDGVIDVGDGIWSDLLLWTDTNHDGVSQANEIGTADESPVVALSTDYREVHRLDAAGNTFRYMSIVHLKREQRPYYDIFFQPVP